MKYRPILGADLSGSLGGITASRTRGTSYFRARSNPVNPQSARQDAVRGNFAALVQRWTQTLTEAQRAAWRVYASSVLVTDSIGQQVARTGQQWYVACNTPRLLNPALSVIDDAPTVFNRGVTAVSAAAEFDALGDLLTFSGTLADPAPADWASGSSLLFIGRPTNPSVTFFAGPWRLGAIDELVEIDATATAFSVSIPASGSVAAGPWGAITAGSVLRVQWGLSGADGRYSRSETFELTVTQAV